MSSENVRKKQQTKGLPLKYLKYLEGLTGAGGVSGRYEGEFAGR